MEFTLVAAAATAVAAMWLVLKVTGASSAFDVTLTAIVAGMFVGRITAMVLVGMNPLANPLDVVLVRGGVDTVGATVGAGAYLVWAARRERRVLPSLAPAATAGLAGWHAGCLWRGSCLGAAADVPWGWPLPGSEMVRHPVELYTAVLLAAATVVLARKPVLRRPGVALAAMAAARLVTGPLRPGLGTDPAWWYATAVLLGVVWAVAERRSPVTSPVP